jgi:hypothetical protein
MLHSCYNVFSRMWTFIVSMCIAAYTRSSPETASAGQDPFRPEARQALPGKRSHDWPHWKDLR